jgi:hypothetical protein
MDRRGFLGAITKALATLGLVGKAKPEGHYYDWGEFGKPLTTNPDHIGKLTHGLHNKVFVGGEELKVSAIRFLTGPEGWVEFYLRDANGQFIEDENLGELKRGRVTGNVEFKTDLGGPANE